MSTLATIAATALAATVGLSAEPGSSSTGSSSTGSSSAGSTSARSMSAGSNSASSNSGSNPGSNPTGSTSAGSTSAGSTSASSNPTGSTSARSNSAASTTAPETLRQTAPQTAPRTTSTDKIGPKEWHRKVKVPPHFVFANHYGVTWGLGPIPSGDIAFFFGRALPALAPSRAHQRWALGYQLTLSVGSSDRYALSSLTQRHHLMAVSYGTLRPRLYAAIGGGLAIFSGGYLPTRPRDWRPSVAEVEGRLGYIFGRRRDHRRLVGVVGGTARLGWNAASLEKAPVPQLGAFIGFLVR